jgi:hypothetical protein
MWSGKPILLKRRRLRKLEERQKDGLNVSVGQPDTSKYTDYHIQRKIIRTFSFGSPLWIQQYIIVVPMTYVNHVPENGFFEQPLSEIGCRQEVLYFGFMENVCFSTQNNTVTL